ncbi:MAG: hypothetical protein E6Q97_07110 [Desulfurellales bacterium]|nr:MAG: hypothetical protein E6Q97_07110 [Desulfurellales bacterium]
MNKKYSVACGEFLKSVPDGLFKKPHDLYGYATVEVPDADGDIVRVDGIRLNYFKAAGSLPLVMQHRTSLLENGETPSLGAITEFARTTTEIAGRKVKALAFGADWERHQDAITEKASKYKSRYDEGSLSTFSMGFDTFAVDSAYKGRGHDITDSDPFEVSCCVVPTNRFATVIRRLKAEMSEEFDADELNEVRMVGLHDELQALTALQKSHETIFNKLLSRLDDIESAVAAASERREAKPTSSRELSPTQMSALLKAVDEMRLQLA